MPAAGICFDGQEEVQLIEFILGALDKHLISVRLLRAGLDTGWRVFGFTASPCSRGQLTFVMRRLYLRVPPRRRSAQMLYDFRAELEYNRAGLGMSMEAIQIFSPMFWAEGLRGAVMSLAPVVGAVLGLAFAVTALAAFWRRA